MYRCERISLLFHLFQVYQVDVFTPHLHVALSLHCLCLALLLSCFRSCSLWLSFSPINQQFINWFLDTCPQNQNRFSRIYQCKAQHYICCGYFKFLSQCLCLDRSTGQLYTTWHREIADVQLFKISPCCNHKHKCTSLCVDMLLNYCWMWEHSTDHTHRWCREQNLPASLLYSDKAIIE